MSQRLRVLTPLLIVLAVAACQREPAATEASPPPSTPANDASAGASLDPDDGTPPPGPTAGTDEGVIDSAWRCGDRPVAARFDNGAGTVTLTHDRGELVLPQARSASGARYADANGNEFWNKGNEATLTLSGQEALACQERSADAAVTE